MCRKRSALCAVRVFSSDNKGWEGGQQVKSFASAQYRHVKHNTQLKTDTKDAFLGSDRHNAYSKLADTRQTVARHHARDPLVCIASSSQRREVQFSRLPPASQFPTHTPHKTVSHRNSGPPRRGCSLTPQALHGCIDDPLQVFLSHRFSSLRQTSCLSHEAHETRPSAQRPTATL